MDESGSDHRTDPGTYLLAAAICPVEAEPDVRERISPLRLPGQVKLHWRDERRPKRRHQITQTIVDSGLDHIVVVRTGALDDSIERRRRKCLDTLLHELEQRQILDVVLESRGKADDRRDVEMLNALRGQRHITSPIRLNHVIGRHESMLWIPDAVCGAITSARTGTDAYQQLLGERLTLIEI